MNEEWWEQPACRVKRRFQISFRDACDHFPVAAMLELLWAVAIHSRFGRAACSACVEFSLPLFKGCWAERALPWSQPFGGREVLQWLIFSCSLLADMRSAYAKCERMSREQCMLLPLAALPLGRHEHISCRGTEQFLLSLLFWLTPC